jgi:SAM-dependent methyltransferase
MSDFNAAYWDGCARRERKVPVNLSQRYTAVQCIRLFEAGMNYVRTERPVILKTDLWTEGVARSREVLLSAIGRTGPIKAYAMDISPVICERARPWLPGVDIRKGTIEHLPYLEQFFDLILDASTIDHIPNPDAAIAEYARCLKPGGILCVMFACNPGTLQRKRVASSDYFTFRPADIDRMLSGAKFHVLKRYAVHFLNTFPFSPLMLGASVLRWHGLVNCVAGFELSGLSHRFSRWAPLYAVVARKE